MSESHTVPGSSDGTRPTNRIRVTDLQYAWLAELGLSHRLLEHYRPTPTKQLQEGKVAGPELARSVLKQAGLQAGGQSLPARINEGVSAAAPARQVKTGTEAGRADDSMRQKLRAASPSIHAAPERGALPSDLAGLAVHAAACQACGLHGQRDQLVFGAGEADRPEWLIVGEAPGKADDRTGQPFQGKAGRLLHAMLVAAGIHSQVFIPGGEETPVPGWSQATSMYFTNLLKCRPLGNRSPVESEIRSCLPYLMQQIDILQPGRILVLGVTAAQALLQTGDDIHDLRGKVHTLTTTSGRSIPLVVTWHPAALLVRPQNKADVWEDLNLARKTNLADIGGQAH